MQTFKMFMLLASSLMFSWCSSPEATPSDSSPTIPIIPKPASMRVEPGNHSLDGFAKIYAETDLMEVAMYLSATISPYLEGTLAVEEWNGNEKASRGIYLSSDPSISNPEAYVLDIGSKQIFIQASTPHGVFYAIQSFRQLLPAGALNNPQASISIPALNITDQPRYSYRGMHLDVGRHFFSVDFIKRYIDLLALHKLNTFHWHLTEDQGWRIEIKQYPKLTEVGAYRDETLVGHYRDQPHQFDGERYGGYYTQEEVREIVAYASERYVTVIPEIEMPGHAMAALTAYPELACTEGPFKVAQKWGIFEEIFCPTEETFTFLENVLLEVMELFPSQYIHIGGDEAPKIRWEESPAAQAVMRREELEDEHELQSYFIQRIEKFVNSHGKQIIGWDEILEGGLAPHATVMSWRGTEGGIEAARQGHDVIMTPTSYLYFDYYQADPSQEPLAIGGMLPLEKVYHFEPTPEELSEEEAQHILGAQANLWTEYIKTPDKVEYMVYPRACALAELNWTPATSKDYNDFVQRLVQHFDLLDALDVNYSKAVYSVEPEIIPDSSEQKLAIALKTGLKDLTIRYTLDGNEPSGDTKMYTAPFSPEKSTTIKAAVFKNEEKVGNTMHQDIYIHQAITFKPVLTYPPSGKYNAGPFVLTNGIRGTQIFNDLWYGFDGNDFAATLDLKTVKSVDTIQIGFLHTPYAWIFYPSIVQIEVSRDGESYDMLYNEPDPLAILEETPVGMKNHTLAFSGKEIRYLRITAQNTIIPNWHGGSGNGSWLFVDEIVVK